MKAAIEELSSILGLDHLLNIKVAELSFGQRRLVECARTISNKSRYVLLDEPAAGLTEEEREALKDVLRSITRMGTGIGIIEHNLRFVADIADTVTLLDMGRVLVAGPTQQVLASEEFVAFGG